MKKVIFVILILLVIKVEAAWKYHDYITDAQAMQFDDCQKKWFQSPKYKECLADTNCSIAVNAAEKCWSQPVKPGQLNCQPIYNSTFNGHPTNLTIFEGPGCYINCYNTHQPSPHNKTSLAIWETIFEYTPLTDFCASTIELINSRTLTASQFNDYQTCATQNPLSSCLAYQTCIGDATCKDAALQGQVCWELHCNKVYESSTLYLFEGPVCHLNCFNNYVPKSTVAKTMYYKFLKCPYMTTCMDALNAINLQTFVTFITSLLFVILTLFNY